MRILISNDDGVHAPGIKSLYKALSKVAEVIVVAPLEERSSTGHTITLDQPLRLVEIDKNIYGCSGYPADCTLMGLAHLLKDNRPDLVISGINKGANLGQDIFYSGTVAAARESVFRGVPAIAISTVSDLVRYDDGKVYFDVAAEFVTKLVKSGVHKLLDPMTVLNINVPNLPENELKGIELTNIGFRNYEEDIQKRVDFRNRDYFWIAGAYQGFSQVENSDCLAIDAAKISLSPLNVLSHSTDEHSKWSTFLDNLPSS